METGCKMIYTQSLYQCLKREYKRANLSPMRFTYVSHENREKISRVRNWDYKEYFEQELLSESDWLLIIVKKFKITYIFLC